MPKMEWYRRWHGTWKDPKLRHVAALAKVPLGVALAVWDAILEESSESEQRGALPKLDKAVIATTLQFTLSDVERVWAGLEHEQTRMIGGGLITAWEKRQAPHLPPRLATVDGVRVEDSASQEAERKRAYGRAKVARCRARKTAQAAAEKSRQAAAAAGQGWLAGLPVPPAPEAVPAGQVIPALAAPAWPAVGFSSAPGAGEGSPARPPGNGTAGFPAPEVSSLVSVVTAEAVTPVTPVTPEVTAVTPGPEPRRNPRVTSAPERERESESKKERKEGCVEERPCGRAAPLGNPLPSSALLREPSPANVVIDLAAEAAADATRRKELRRQKVLRYLLSTRAGGELAACIDGMMGFDPAHDEQWWFDKFDAERVSRGWDDKRDQKVTRWRQVGAGISRRGAL